MQKRSAICHLGLVPEQQVAYVCCLPTLWSDYLLHGKITFQARSLHCGSLDGYVTDHAHLLLDLPQVKHQIMGRLGCSS